MDKERAKNTIIEVAKQSIVDLEGMRKYLGDEFVDEQINFWKQQLKEVEALETQYSDAEQHLKLLFYFFAVKTCHIMKTYFGGILC